MRLKLFFAILFQKLKINTIIDYLFLLYLEFYIFNEI